MAAVGGGVGAAVCEEFDQENVGRQIGEVMTF